MIFRNPAKPIFSLPPLISFKRDKDIGNFLVRSSFQANEQPGTFTCARSRCKSCPFVEKTSGSKISIKITDHFTLFLFSRHHIPTNSVAPFSAYKPTHNPQFLQSLWRRANARNVSLFTLPPTQHHSFFRNLPPLFKRSKSGPSAIK